MKRFFLIAGMIFFAGLCQIGFSDVPLDPCNRKSERNKAVVRGYMENILNQGDLTGFGDYFSENAIFNNSRVDKGHFEKMINTIRQAFPDFRLVIEDQIAEGDKVVTRVTFHGTHKGEFRGVPPTGKEISYAGIAIDRIVDGKVVEMWHEADSLSMLRQIGALPPPQSSKEKIPPTDP